MLRLTLRLRWRSDHIARLSPLHEVAGSILSEDIFNVTQAQCSTHVRRVSQHSAESRGFSPSTPVPPTGKLTGWVRINADREVKSQLL